MSTLRLTLAAMTATMLVAAAAALNACGQPTDVYICSIPVPGELGADGGPDPCHCNVVDGTSCLCTSPGDGMFLLQQCLAALRGFEDAGDAEGGP